MMPISAAQPLAPQPSQSSQIEPIDQPVDGQNGALALTLSEGAERPDEVAARPVTQGMPLSGAETQAILDRLPTLDAPASDQQAFRLPAESLPPPRTGETISETFPPTETVTQTAEVVDGPLAVLRFSPEGEIPLAPFLNVTFNQPMVPLATVEQLSEQDVPVTLSPDVPGTWRWLGTRTLTFEYDDANSENSRFPMATVFTATVPADIVSAMGNALDEAVSWSFRTPPPQLETSSPNFGPQPLEPLFFVSFNQRVDPAAVLDTISVRAGGEEFALRLATQAEIDADATVKSLLKRANDETWLAFRAEAPLSAGTTVAVNVGPGTPSAEGPLTTEDAQSFTFETYSALRVDDQSCGTREYGDCAPFSPLTVFFNNPLDESSFDPSQVQIEPALPDAIIEAFGSTLRIRGATQGRTTYTVTLDGNLRDAFGQTLGSDVEVSFRVGPAANGLFGPNQPLVTLDPADESPSLTVYSVNYNSLRVRIHRVQPEDWPQFLQFRDVYNRNREQRDSFSPPGEPLRDETLAVNSADDALTATDIDLSDFLGDSPYGHFVVTIEPPAGLLERTPLNNIFGGGNRPVVHAWVQVTEMGLDIFHDHSELVAWANALADGAPLGNVTLRLFPSDDIATTDADGTARFALSRPGNSLLIAERETDAGVDVALLPGSPYYYDENFWQKQPVSDEVRWYVIDDRALYRPGETVHLKGFVRQIGGTQGGDVGLLDRGERVNYTVYEPQGNEIASGEAALTEFGGFDFSFDVPESANLGYAYVELNLPSRPSTVGYANYSHSFQIQEFRRPEFEVSARNETTGPYFIGDEAVVAIEATYFAGGPLPGAETNWTVSATPTSYTPPGWNDFNFGTWTPWWRYHDDYAYANEIFQQFSSTTDPSGTHYLRVGFDATVRLSEEPQPYSLLANATVLDVNRQAYAATTSLMVHPSSLYVGLRGERVFVDAGEPLTVDAIVTDVEGSAVAGRGVTLEASRLEWRYADGEWTEEAVDPQSCEVTSAEEPVSCEFETEKGGQYQIVARVLDDLERPNESTLTRWVSGGARPPARGVEQEEVVIVPDKEAYQPGDTARLLVQSPFSPAEGVLTLSRNGILSTERFAIEDGSTTLDIPIEDGYIPNLHISVDLVGSAPRIDDAGETLPDLPPRPTYASGGVELSIPPLNRTLDLAIDPAASALEPGASTEVDVALTDAAGAPVADAELAVIVVDEAVLALTGYQLTDPLAVFYQSRPSYVSRYHSRSTLVLEDPQALVEQAQQAVPAEDSAPMLRSFSADDAGAPAPAAAPMAEMEMAESAMMTDTAEADESAAGADSAPIAVRSNFDPLAIFAPDVRTDADGRATVAVELPDNLTRYRVMVVAVADGKLFGSAEANLTARLPLMVRPSAPRFLNFGDVFELPVVVQNQTDEEMEVQVALEASNLMDSNQLSVTSGQSISDTTVNETSNTDSLITGTLITVPANDRVEVRFPASTSSAGTARFRVVAASGGSADAATVDLPVYTPATSEAFAVYGVLDEGAIAQPLQTPENVFPQFGGLTVSTSSTALQSLTDAVLYLVSYPYECSEQMASRILAVSALRDVLSAFEAEGLPAPEEIQASVTRDVERLVQMQNGDGGWPIWQRGRDSVPFYSIHATYSLLRAQSEDFAVPQETLDRAIEHLREIESHFPSWYSDFTRNTLAAYALYVRSLAGDVDAPAARALLNEARLDGMSLEGLAWLLPILGNEPASSTQADEIRRHFNNRAVETAGAANFTTSYGDDDYLMLHSNRRTDGVILEALIADQPESDLIPKIVNGLLANRTRGRWTNTQENVFILLALDSYFNTFEATTPDFVARIWLGDTYAAQHEFEGRTTETRETTIPMEILLADEPSTTNKSATNNQLPLTIAKEGDGRLYYRLGLRYAPDNLDLDPLDQGFTVQRVYEAVDDPADVTRDADGTWRIKAGARVRVRVQMVAENRRYHVALVDPLPAGLEAINPALATSEPVPADPNDESRSQWWWWGTWYEHQNLRDQRAEAFTTLLWEGVYDYTYVARATTPGTFVVPPAKAEEMYAPEVFGRSGSDRVVVE